MKTLSIEEAGRRRGLSRTASYEAAKQGLLGQLVPHGRVERQHQRKHYRVLVGDDDPRSEKSSET